MRFAVIALILWGVLFTGSALSQSYRAEAKAIIYSVFPAATRDAAFRVADCETVHFTDFYNNKSRASDLFQEMPGNHRRIFSAKGYTSMKLDFGLLSSNHPTRYAAEIALRQSHGGYNWGEWVCKP